MAVRGFVSSCPNTCKYAGISRPEYLWCQPAAEFKHLASGKKCAREAISGCLRPESWISKPPPLRGRVGGQFEPAPVADRRAEGGGEPGRQSAAALGRELITCTVVGKEAALRRRPVIHYAERTARLRRERAPTRPRRGFRKPHIAVEPELKPHQFLAGHRVRPIKRAKRAKGGCARRVT